MKVSDWMAVPPPGSPCSLARSRDGTRGLSRVTGRPLVVTLPLLSGVAAEVDVVLLMLELALLLSAVAMRGSSMALQGTRL